MRTAGMWLAVGLALALGSVGCREKSEDTTQQTNAVAKEAKLGTRVQAPWSREEKMSPGKVTEVYGKLAHIDFDHGDRRWTFIARLVPPGDPGPDPSDTCSIQTGQQVRAPRSSDDALFPGKVTETYGKLAHIDFEDGDRGWALCDQTKPR